MKSRIVCVIILSVMIWITQTVYSEGNITDNYRYTEIEDGVKLLGYLGKEAIVNIPYEINGKPVTVIGKDCFACNETIWSVNVPENIHTIEEDAFAWSSIHQIYLPNSLVSIGEGAFYASKITIIYLPDAIESLGEYIFAECHYLRSAYISSEITILPKAAFADCSHLLDVYLSDMIHVIDVDAFYGCAELKYIHLPIQLQLTYYSSFYETRSLDKEIKNLLEGYYYSVDDD